MLKPSSLAKWHSERIQIRYPYLLWKKNKGAIAEWIGQLIYKLSPVNSIFDFVFYSVFDCISHVDVLGLNSKWNCRTESNCASSTHALARGKISERNFLAFTIRLARSRRCSAQWKDIFKLFWIHFIANRPRSCATEKDFHHSWVAGEKGVRNNLLLSPHKCLNLKSHSHCSGYSFSLSPSFLRGSPFRSVLRGRNNYIFCLIAFSRNHVTSFSKISQNPRLRLQLQSRRELLQASARQFGSQILRAVRWRSQFQIFLFY